ncbi:hypothetical protein [Elizabethkingia sp. JS20170427COW]|uniref:hypothetical protein n=1 Tax=Elizabethkingia sp. JS20170427COW TaxID=2583851 RepID=UPI001110A62D|nr:hypothetical protein [Elizabethkingia sp. JS20170427COW]QCX54350.1 hypothetical protein FGE20_11670 [Elizabethkingia sp. JS20170427COW]
MKIFPIITILLFTNLFSQKISYEISLCGRNQKIILTSKNNKNYKGLVINEFFKRNSDKKIIKKVKIKKSVAKSLFNELTEQGINEHKKIIDSTRCGEFYLDGDYLSFKTLKNNKIFFEKAFAEVYPESEAKTEKNSCRREAQKLITIADKELNLKALYSKIFKSLPKNYCYWSGIYMVCKINK